MARHDGRKLDHKTLESYRILAVRRVVEDGAAPSGVMQSLGLCRTTIYRWLRAHRKGGQPALCSRKSAGPKPRLTAEQRIQVREWIVGRDPRQYGFDFGLWTRGGLELHFLPPYAPDLNPDEFVWQHAKTNGTAKRPLKQNESLKERVIKDLAAIKAKPKLVRAFFRAPSVAYATY